MNPKGPLGFLAAELEALKEANLLRERAPHAGALDFSTNDYLGYAAARAHLAGASASRLVSGSREEHWLVEADLAQWLGAEAALLFSSGYAANVGTLTALLGRGDLVVSDALNHASLIDGMRLSRAEIVVIPHLDVDALESALTSDAARGARRRYFVTESYFGMDADSPRFPEVAALCRDAGAALIVDEAHALGVFGPEGRGVAAAAGVVPDVLLGTCGKALGVAGAFAAGGRLLVDWLWNRARSFVFSTAISPLVAAEIRRSLGRVRKDDERRRRLLALAAAFRSRLAALGIPAAGYGPVVPVLLGDAERALAASRTLGRRGFHVPAIRPPTVPVGTARLRVGLRSDMSRALVDSFILALTYSARAR